MSKKEAPLPKSKPPKSSGAVRSPKASLKNKPVVEIKRHSFGLISLYAMISLGAVAFFLVFYLYLSGAERALLVSVSYIVVVALIVLFIFIAHVYNGNSLTITHVEVRQITQEAIFVNKSSVLSLANIEDVTIIKRGFFAHVFNFGTLNIETAGEQENFKFKYCPQPELFERKLMKMREKYLHTMQQDQLLR